MFNDRVREALRVLDASSYDAAWLELGTLDTASIAARLVAFERLLGQIKYLPPAARLGAVDRIEQECGFSVSDFVRTDRPMMLPEEVRALSRAGMEIGGHTRNHPILESLDEAVARAEIEGGRADLAEIVGAAPQPFAYPNGKMGDDFGLAHRAMVQRAGFAFAFTTHIGAAGAGSDPYLLPRYMPWQRRVFRFKTQALRLVAAAAR